jgi:hypothetical protein
MHRRLHYFILVAGERIAVSAFYRALALIWVNAGRLGATIDEMRRLL